MVFVIPHKLLLIIDKEMPFLFFRDKVWIDLNNKKKLTKIKFPKRPETFMLSEKVMENYFLECSIVDSNKKMTDLMRMFMVFKVSMETNLANYRSHEIVYRFFKREYYDFYIKLIWLLGLLNNILM